MAAGPALRAGAAALSSRICWSFWWALFQPIIHAGANQQPLSVFFRDSPLAEEPLVLTRSTDALRDAIALEGDFTLATRNVQEFQGTGVRIANPWS